MLSRLVITFLPRIKRLLILWLQSPSAVILEPPKIKADKMQILFDALISSLQNGYCFLIIRIVHAYLEKTLESPLDCKKIQPVHPKGDQSRVFIGRTDVEAETLILWPPDVKS